MQRKDKVDPQTIEQLRRESKKYDEAINNNDAAAVAALFTEDAVFVTDSGPVYGRKAIEKSHADFFQQWHCSNHTVVADQYSPHVIGTAGNEIWWNGEWSQTLQGKGGDSIEVKGSALDVGRSGFSRVLKCFCSVNNESRAQW